MKMKVMHFEDEADQNIVDICSKNSEWHSHLLFLIITS